VEEVTEVGWCAGASGGRRATVCGGGRGPRPATSCAMVLSLALAVEGRKGFGTGKSLVIAFGPRKVLERFQISQKKTRRCFAKQMPIFKTTSSCVWSP
jgi:hypothetical protein